MTAGRRTSRGDWFWPVSIATPIQTAAHTTRTPKEHKKGEDGPSSRLRRARARSIARWVRSSSALESFGLADTRSTSARSSGSPPIGPPTSGLRSLSASISACSSANSSSTPFAHVVETAACERKEGGGGQGENAQGRPSSRTCTVEARLLLLLSAAETGMGMWAALPSPSPLEPPPLPLLATGAGRSESSAMSLRISAKRSSTKETGKGCEG